MSELPKPNEGTKYSHCNVGKTDDVFAVSEGSVIRVATNCDRNMKNTGAANLVYICIQAKEGSLEGYTMTDAKITEHENKL